MTNKVRHSNKKSTQPIDNAAKKTLRILLADDDDEMRGLLAEMLHGEGYVVVECPNGWSLLKNLRDYLIRSTNSQNKEVDLVISDIRMPGVTGLEVLEGMRSIENCPPIILITAFGDRATHERAEQCGVTAMFDKPFDIDELLAKVDEIARRQKLT